MEEFQEFMDEDEGNLEFHYIDVQDSCPLSNVMNSYSNHNQLLHKILPHPFPLNTLSGDPSTLQNKTKKISVH